MAGFRPCGREKMMKRIMAPIAQDMKASRGKRALRHKGIYNDITELIGNTPIVRLNRIIPPTPERMACAKLEFFGGAGTSWQKQIPSVTRLRWTL